MCLYDGSLQIQAPAEDHGHLTKPHLYLVGAGISFPDHLTLESIEIMASCTLICSNLPQSGLETFPEHLRSKCQSLWPIYQDNRNRADNYKDVAQAVIDATVAKPPVAWMTSGHPLIFDSVSQILLKAGRTRGWNVRVVPAISCIDTILAEVKYDPANGLLIYEASGLVLRRLPLIPSFATLLLQPSAFGSEVAHYSSNWMPDLAPLRDYLLRFYGPKQECAFVRSHSMLGGNAQIYSIDLADMASAPFEAIAGSTLFLRARGNCN
jgi:hypothetical protein